MLITVLFSLALLNESALTALTGATLIDGTGAEPIRDAVVVVDGPTIRCAGTKSECPVPEQAQLIELENHYITPGLVDAHVHYSQTGWADGRPDALDVRARFPYPEVIAALEANPQRWHRANLCSGVTAVFDVGGYPWTWDIREAAAQNPRAPHYQAAGPLLSTLDHWLNLPAARQFIYLEEPAQAKPAVEYLAAFDTDAVKLWFIQTDDADSERLRAIAIAAGKQAELQGLPLLVHATELKAAKAAVAAGADMLVHSVDDQLVDKTFVQAMRENQVIYVPTLTVHGGYFSMYKAAITGAAPDIDDPNGCVDEAMREKIALSAELGELLPGRDQTWLSTWRARLDKQEHIMASNLKKLYEAGVTIATGTDAGNPLTLHGAAIFAEMEAMQAAGMPPMAVIEATTRNGARAMGERDAFGTVEAGKAADLLVLSADPSEDVANFRALEYVMRAGKLYPQASLVVWERP